MYWIALYCRMFPQFVPVYNPGGFFMRLWNSTLPLHLCTLTVGAPSTRAHHNSDTASPWKVAVPVMLANNWCIQQTWTNISIHLELFSCKSIVLFPSSSIFLTPPPLCPWDPGLGRVKSLREQWLNKCWPFRDQNCTVCIQYIGYHISERKIRKCVVVIWMRKYEGFICRAEKQI